MVERTDNPMVRRTLNTLLAWCLTLAAGPGSGASGLRADEADARAAVDPLPSARAPRHGARPASRPYFREMWRLELPDWAYFMTIRNGVVYTQWSSGILSATDLYTGDLLRYVEGVAYATAPLIIGNRIYSYNVNRLHEIDLESFELLRSFEIFGSGYAESIPYDAETGSIFLWRWLGEQDSRMSAVQLESGTDVWFTEFSLGPVLRNTGSPVLPGDDSVYVQAANGLNRVYRFDKRTGALRWMTCLTPGDLVDFNNMIYDRARDVLYVSTVDANLFALRRTDGAVLWSQAFPGYEIHATLSSHDGHVYVPLFGSTSGPGAYAALDASNGVPVWVEPGFFHEDGWSATAVDDRYLYRNTHNGDGRIIVQDRRTGALVWSGDAGAPQPCTNPVQSDGIVVFGNGVYLIAIEVATGLPVDCHWHGLYGTGYNPGAILWDDQALDPDLDDDLLPDVWEVSTFDHLFTGANDDSDGDGSANYSEYLAGTDSTWAEDSLKLHLLTARDPHELRFVTRETAGLSYRGQRRFYAVESAPSVTGPHWMPLTNAERIAADGRTVSLPLPASPTSRFYRVRAWLEPE